MNDLKVRQPCLSRKKRFYNSLSTAISNETPMKKRLRTILLIVFGLLVVIPLLLMMLPEGSLDLSKDEEPFRSMVLPPKSARGFGYMDAGPDGGSIGFELIDKTGAKFEINFPIHYDGGLNPRPEAFCGNINDRSQIPLKDTRRAKVIVIQLLKQYGPVKDEYHSTENAIIDLSEPIVRIPALFWENTKEWFRTKTGTL